MTSLTEQAALARTLSALVTDDEVGDTLARLVHDCAEMLSAPSVALLVRDGGTQATLLAATTRSTVELEMLEALAVDGPCAEAISTREPVFGEGVEELTRRWEHAGPAITRAGYSAIEVYPMRWRGRALGGLHVFHSSHQGSRPLLAQTFTDLATIALLHAFDLSQQQILARVHEALSARGVIEQAKGVLMHTERIDAERAHARLEQIARSSGSTLSETARVVSRRPGRSTR